MKIKIDQDKCIACGLCVNMCPKVFKVNSNGKSYVISQQDIDCAKKASGSCPVDAIKFE